LHLLGSRLDGLVWRLVPGDRRVRRGMTGIP
jgi:hypothetical protein